jgi:phosphatidylinositol glycan class Q protein
MLSFGSPLLGMEVSTSTSPPLLSNPTDNIPISVVLDRILLPNLPAIIYLIGLSAATGTTMSLALCSDLLSLSTLHLYLFYSMATAVFSFHTSAMDALFNIFRGKKRNVLRNRIEPSSYTLDQLLVGAILFTLAAFLLPTVLAFYLVFAAVSSIEAIIGEGVVADPCTMCYNSLAAPLLRYMQA